MVMMVYIHSLRAPIHHARYEANQLTHIISSDPGNSAMRCALLISLLSQGVSRVHLSHKAAVR